MKVTLLAFASSLAILLSLFPNFSVAQEFSAGVNVDSPNPNAVLHLRSPNNNQGLLIPTMTGAQRLAMTLAGGDDVGIVVFDTTDNAFYFWDGSAWVRVANTNQAILANILGVSNDAGGNQITNLADPINPQDVATKNYVDNQADIDNQDLTLTGNTLNLTNDATPVDLSGFLDNTDNQNLSNVLGVGADAGGTTITNLGPPINPNDAATRDYVDNQGDSDDQDLTLVGNELVLTNDATNVDLSVFLDNTDNQDLLSVISVNNDAGNNRIVNVGEPVDPGDVATRNYVDTQGDSDDQDLDLAGTVLSLTNDATPVDLSGFLDNTDTQNLTDVLLQGNDAGGVPITNVQDPTDPQDVATRNYVDSQADNQDLDLVGNTLSLTNDATPVDLSAYLDNTDAQDLDLAGNTLSLSGDGTTVDLSGYLDNTDAQDLDLAGNTLSLTGDGTTVDLSGYLDNTDAQNLANVLGQGNDAGGVAITNVQDPTNPQDVATRNYVDSQADNQDLDLAGNTLSLTNDATPVDLSLYLDNTDAQDLDLSGNTLSLTGDGTTVDLSGYIQTAATVTSTATTNVAATTVQGAIAELDNEKLAIAGGTMTGDLDLGSNNLGVQGITTLDGDVVLLGDVLGANPITFQGLTDNANTTTLAVADPSGTNTITIPDASGTLFIDGVGLNALTAAEVTQIGNIDANTINNTQWGYLAGTNQGVATTDNVTFGQVDVTGISNLDGNVNLGDNNADLVTMNGDLTVAGDVLGASPFVFQGLTDNANTTTLAIADPSAVNTITIPDASGTLFIDGVGLNALTAAEVTQIGNIDANTINNTQWGYLAGTNQGVATTDNVTFGQVDVTGISNLDGNVNLGDNNADLVTMNGDLTVAGDVLGASPFVFQGLTDNANTTTLAVADPSGTNTITIPDASGTLFIDGVGLNALTAAEVTQIGNIDANLINNTQWGYLAGTDQGVATTDNVTFGQVDVTGISNLDGNVNLGDNNADLVTMNGDLTVAGDVLGASPFVFQGLTDNANTTTLAIADPSAVNTITIPDASGTLFIDGVGLNALTAAEVTQIGNIDANTINNTQWGYLAGTNQGVATTDNVTFGQVDVTGISNLDGNVNLGDNNADLVTMNGDLTVAGDVLGATPFIFQGLTDNANTTTLAIADPSAVNTITIPDASGTLFIDGVGLNALTAAEVTQIGNIDANLINNTQWGYLAGTNQGVATTDNVTFGQVDVTSISNLDGNVNLGDNNADLVTMNGDLTVAGDVLGASPFVFQGLTDNANTTTLAVADPSGTNTITIPDASGTLFIDGVGLNALTAAEVTQIGNIDANTINNTQWGYLAGTNQGVATTDNVTFGQVDVTGISNLDGNVNLGDNNADLVTMNGDLTVAGDVLGATPFVFQGLTDNANTTTLAVADPSAVNTITIPDASGTLFIDGVGLNALTAAEVTQIGNIDANLINNTQWGYLAGTDQGVATTDNVTFGQVDVTGISNLDGNVNLGDNNADLVTMNGDLTVAGDVLGASPFVFQGLTDNANTTTLAITDPSAVNTITIPDASGTLFIDGVGLNALTAAEVTQIGNIDANTINNTQWGYLAGTNQGVATTDNVTFGQVDVTGISNLDGNVNLGDNNADLVTMNGDLTVAGDVLGASPFVFQGLTDNANTTTLAVADPSGTNTITIPDASGTLFIDGVGLNALTAAEVTQIGNIDANLINNTQWGYLAGTNQGVATTDNVTFGQVDVTGISNLDGNVNLGDNNADLVTMNGDLTVAGDVLGASPFVFQGLTDNANTTTLAIADPSAVNTITIPDASGTLFIDGVGLNALTAAEVTQIGNIDANTINNTQWGYLAGTNQGVATTDNVTFGQVDVTGISNLDGNVNLGDNNADLVTMNGDLTVAGDVLGATPFIFQGLTDNANTTTLAIADPSAVNTITIPDASGTLFIDGVGLNALTAAEVTQIGNIDANLINNTQWGYLAGTNQGVATTDNVTFGQVDVTSISNLDGNVNLGDNNADLVTMNGDLTVAGDVLGATPFIFQGLTDNANTTTLAVADPSAVNTITIPDASGTLALDTDLTALNNLISNPSSENIRVGNAAGSGLLAGGDNNVMVGENAGSGVTTGDNNVLVGRNAAIAITTGSSNTVIGAGASATGGAVAQGTALGAGTSVGASRATAIGDIAQATANDAIAIGHNAQATAEGAIAIGDNVTAGVANTILLGNTTDGYNVGIGTSNPLSALQVGDKIGIFHFDDLGAGPPPTPVVGEVFADNVHPVGTDIVFTTSDEASLIFLSDGGMEVLSSGSTPGVGGNSAFASIGSIFEVDNVGNGILAGAIQLNDLNGGVTPVDGMIRFNGTNLQAREGGNWLNITNPTFPLSASQADGGPLLNVNNTDTGTGTAASFSSDGTAATVQMSNSSTAVPSLETTTGIVVGGLTSDALGAIRFNGSSFEGNVDGSGTGWRDFALPNFPAFASQDEAGTLLSLNNINTGTGNAAILSSDGTSPTLQVSNTNTTVPSIETNRGIVIGNLTDDVIGAIRFDGGTFEGNIDGTGTGWFDLTLPNFPAFASQDEAGTLLSLSNINTGTGNAAILSSDGTSPTLQVSNTNTTVPSIETNRGIVIGNLTDDVIGAIRFDGGTFEGNIDGTGTGWFDLTLPNFPAFASQDEAGTLLSLSNINTGTGNAAILSSDGTSPTLQVSNTNTTVPSIETNRGIVIGNLTDDVIGAIRFDGGTFEGNIDGTGTGWFDLTLPNFPAFASQDEAGTLLSLNNINTGTGNAAILSSDGTSPTLQVSNTNTTVPSIETNRGIVIGNLTDDVIGAIRFDGGTFEGNIDGTGTGWFDLALPNFPAFASQDEAGTLLSLNNINTGTGNAAILSSDGTSPTLQVSNTNTTVPSIETNRGIVIGNLTDDVIGAIRFDGGTFEGNIDGTGTGWFDLTVANFPAFASQDEAGTLLSLNNVNTGTGSAAILSSDGTVSTLQVNSSNAGVPSISTNRGITLGNLTDDLIGAIRFDGSTFEGNVDGTSTGWIDLADGGFALPANEVDGTTVAGSASFTITNTSTGAAGRFQATSGPALELDGNIEVFAGTDRTLQVGPNGSANGNSFSIRAGNTTNSGSNGGNLSLFGGDGNGAGDGGNIQLQPGIGSSNGIVDVIGDFAVSGDALLLSNIEMDETVSHIIGVNTNLSGAGGDLTIDAGDSPNAGNAGNLNLNAGGAGSTGNGGNLSLTAGNGSTSDTGGAVTINSGSGNNAGSISLTAASSSGSGSGGSISLTTGSGSGGNGIINLSGPVSFNNQIQSNLNFQVGSSRSISMSTNTTGGVDNLTISAGNATFGAPIPGGSLTLNAGNGTTTGDGGSVFINAGTGGSGTPGIVDVTGDLRVGNTGSGGGSIEFEDGGGANALRIQANASSSAYTITMPQNQGTGTLTNDGAGNLSWIVATGGALTQDPNNNLTAGAGTTGDGLSTGANNIFQGSDAAPNADGNENIVQGILAAPALTSGDRNIVIGASAGTTLDAGDDNVILGSNTVLGASSTTTVVIGSAAQSVNTNTVAIGNTANAGGLRAVSIGNTSQASGQDAVAVGQSTNAVQSAVAVGGGATAGENGAIALGFGALVSSTSTNSVAIGAGTFVNNTANVIALGDGANNNLNVGIGTAAPTTRLDVNGGTRVNGTLNVLGETTINGLVSTVTGPVDTDNFAADTRVIVLNPDAFDGVYTDIDAGVDGKEIILIGAADGIIIQDLDVDASGNIELANNRTVSLNINSQLNLVYRGGVWNEMSTHSSGAKYRRVSTLDGGFGTYSVRETDNMIFINAGGTGTIELPNAPLTQIGREIQITTASTNGTTVNAPGANIVTDAGILGGINLVLATNQTYIVTLVQVAEDLWAITSQQRGL